MYSRRPHKQFRTLASAAAIAAMAGIGLAPLAGTASAASLTFTELTGFVGGSPAETGIYRADLSTSGVGTLQSITIRDSNSRVGGAGSQFSGFDLDGIRLSNTFCATAACVNALPGLNVFDFTSGLLFTPGTQRAPAAALLFGAGPGASTVDNSVATLGLFDANSTTLAGAFGFLSMGDGGELSFNLTSILSTAGLYLYIGEVGNNGEVAAGSITISSNPVDPRVVPIPGSLSLMLGALAFGGLVLRKRRG
jgi:hypothetical protein